MLKRIMAVIMTSLLLLVLFAGCGAGKTANQEADIAPEMARGYNNATADGGYSGAAPASNNVNVQFGKEKGVAATTAAATTISGKGSSEGSAGAPSDADIKKVIKNGRIAVEVKDVDAAYTNVMGILADNKGEEFSKEYAVSGDFKRMTLVLKIPPEKLAEFEQKLKELVGEGHIKSSAISSQDITSQYYDMAARLKSYELSRDQLQKLLEKSTTVEDTLKIHDQLMRIQADIESMQGQIKMWDRLVGMATVTLFIDQMNDPMKRIETASWKFNSTGEIWLAMKNGFINVVNTVYSALVWIVVVIVAILPVLVPAAIILWIILAARRRKKNRNSDNSGNSGNSSTPPLA